MPVHIVFLELIIDPASSIVFEAEPEEPDVMRRPPRDPRAPLFNRSMISLSLLQGGSVALIVLAVFALAGMVRGEAEARALTFTTLVIGNLSLIVAIRSRSGTVLAALRRPTRALGIVLGGALLLLGLVLYVPALADLFQFVPLSVGDLGLAVVAGLASVLWLKGVEILRQ